MERPRSDGSTKSSGIRRNRTELRLAEKRSKRDVEWSHENLLECDRDYRLSSDGDMEGRDDYIRIDNTDLSPEEAAERIIAAFELAPR